MTFIAENRCFFLRDPTPPPHPRPTPQPRGVPAALRCCSRRSHLGAARSPRDHGGRRAAAADEGLGVSHNALLPVQEGGRGPHQRWLRPPALGHHSAPGWLRPLGPPNPAPLLIPRAA